LVRGAPVLVGLFAPWICRTGAPLAVVGCPTGRTGLGRTTFIHTLDADTVFSGFVFQHLGEPVERPPKQVKVAVVAPIGIFTDTSQVAYGNRPDVAGDTLRDDILGDSVEEVYPALVALLVQPLRLTGGTVVALRSFLLEVVIILFECATGVQQSIVANRNNSEITDTEVDICYSVARWVRVVNLDIAYDVQLPFSSGPDCSDLLDVLDDHIWVCVVLRENEILPSVFQIPPLRESNLIMFEVMLESILFEHDCRAWMLVAMFPVAGWVRVLVAVPTERVPRVERFSQLFESWLTGLCVQICVAFVILDSTLFSARRWPQLP
jgi:hypothetical protein